MLARKLRKQGLMSEVLLWKQIKNKSFGVEFHRQVPLDNYIVDFYCHELMLAIEVDGNSHLFEDVAVNDAKRQQKLEKLGVRFIRFEDKDVKQNINMVLVALENKIEQILQTSPFRVCAPNLRFLARLSLRRGNNTNDYLAVNSSFQGGVQTPWAGRRMWLLIPFLKDVAVTPWAGRRMWLLIPLPISIGIKEVPNKLVLSLLEIFHPI